MGRNYTPAITRFLGKIDIAQDGCWNWLGYVDERGYGNFSVWDRVDKKRYVYRAHRWLFEWIEGDQKLGLDHLCRNRKCVNPTHLEPVTCQENILRGEGLAAQNAKKTHCPYGHELDSVLKRGPREGKRYCGTCRNERNRTRRAKEKA